MTHNCYTCNTKLVLNENTKESWWRHGIHRCADCYSKLNHRNTNRMYVNGNYVSKSHPLHKPGRYIIDGFFGEALVESDTSKAGYVYCISNPAWPGWVKVGKAVQDAKRFNSYQTYSPLRDYVLEWSHKVDDVHEVEAAFHRGRKADNGEWYEMTADEALSIISSIPQVGEHHAV